MFLLPKYTDQSQFAHDEDGAATPLALIFCLIFIVLGGFAVDYNKAMSERTQLQIAADSAAHAAAYTWEFQDVDTSRATAMAAITGMLPDVAYEGALTPDDIEFGFWDPDLNEFSADPTFEESKNSPLLRAVRTVANLEPSRNNESRNILLSIVGQDTFTIRTTATYASYYPPCLNEGFVAGGVVDLQSNSNFYDGFCIHSNLYVSLNQNNYFQSGSIVQMPNTGDLDIPNSGFEKNEGLREALRPGKYRMRLLDQLPMMFASLEAGSPKYSGPANTLSSLEIMNPSNVPAYELVLWPVDTSDNKNATAETTDTTTDTTDAGDTSEPDISPVLPRMTAQDTGKKTISPANFDLKNRIYRLDCTGNGDITFSADTFSDFALVTNCPIKFSNGTVLEDVLIATKGDIDASHVQLGRNDGCAPGGGASLWTYGDVKTASALSGYGAQILALGDIQFTANANGIEGVSFIARGEISGTSNGDMGFYGGGRNPDYATAPYFRAVN